jgi:hypothetical protein
MIQKFLTKYWLAFQVIVLFVAVSMSIFKTEITGSVYLFWLSLFAVEALLLLPTVFKEETIIEARKRVFRSLESDLFTYVGLILAGIVGIQWLNSGCSLVYLPDVDVWKFSSPPVEWLPYSVQPLPSLTLLSMVVSLFAAGLVVRIGLGKSGKRFFLDSATIISGMMAAYAVFQSLSGVAPYTIWASQPSACNPGTFFAFWFLMSLGWNLGFSQSKFEPVKAVLWWIFAFGGNLFGFLQFSSAAGLVVYTVIGALLLIYRISMLFFQPVEASKRVYFVMGVLLVFALVSYSIAFLVPKSPILPRARVLAEASAIDQMTASRLFRMNAAFKIWEGAPWTGVGANGFSQYLGTVIEPGDWKQTKGDKQFVWNDGFQFLCEWGVIGAGVLAAMIITLFIPLFVKARAIFTAHDRKFSAWDVFLKFDDYSVPSVVVIVLFLVDGWFSSPFQSPAVLMSWFCVLAVLPGLLPSKRGKHA